MLLGLRDEADEGGGGADVAPVSVIGKMRHAADLIAGEDSAVEQESCATSPSVTTGLVILIFRSV